MSTLLVFDFDYSLIDTDSDRIIYVHSQSDNANSILSILETDTSIGSWPERVTHCLSLLGPDATKVHLSHALAKAPLDDALRQWLLQSTNLTKIILSDANTFYIDTILRAHHLDGQFQKIITNHAQWKLESTQAEKLVVLPFHTKTHSNCQTGECSTNLCKGTVLSSLLSDYSRVIYVGDGKNDYCPSLAMRESDFVLVRRGRALEQCVTRKRPNAQIHFWENYQDLVALLTTLK